MEKFVLLILVVVLIASLVPFTGGAPESRSFEISSLTINFDKTDAIFTVDYELSMLPKIYVLLIGSKSLDSKIQSLFSNFEYEIIKMDQNRAILRMKNVSRLDKDYYLHDSNKFGESINAVYIYTPDSSRPKEYSNLNSTPNIFYRA